MDWATLIGWVEAYLLFGLALGCGLFAFVTMFENNEPDWRDAVLILIVMFAWPVFVPLFALSVWKKYLQRRQARANSKDNFTG